MTITFAAKELDAIRNNRTSEVSELIGRVDAVGQWAACQKHSKKIAKVLQECHQLHEKLMGGSGKGGLRIDVTA